MSRPFQLPHRIVILGAGFAGVRLALELDRLKRNNRCPYSVILINREPFQTFHAELYEVATASFDIQSSLLRESATFSLRRIFSETSVRLIIDTVVGVNEEARQVICSDETVYYDTLIYALGSRSSSFGIPGVREHALGLKTMDDALRIRNQVQQLWKASKRNKRIVIAGGGFSGVECAAELQGYLRTLPSSKKFERPTVTIIEGAQRILPSISHDVSATIQNRLKKLGVTVVCNTRIASITATAVRYGNGRTLQSSMVIWTVGVEGALLPSATVPTDTRGRILVDGFLSVVGQKHRYAIGDIAAIQGKDGNAVVLPQTASLAIDQGRYLARHIVAVLQSNPVEHYRPHFPGFVIPVSGKYAVLLTPYGLRLTGVLGWCVRRLIDLRYAIGLLGIRGGVVYWLSATRLYIRND